MTNNDSLQQLIGSLQNAFRCGWAFVVMVSLLLFTTFFVIGGGSVAKDALETRIATKLIISVYLKPRQSPNQETLQWIRSLPEIHDVELVPPDMADAVIAQRTNSATGVFTKGISPEVFPFALLIQVNHQHLSNVPDLLSNLNKHIQVVQEIRYPAASLQQSLEIMHRLGLVVRQFTMVLCLVAAAGCLTALKTAVHGRQLWCLYSLCGLLAGAIAGILLNWTGGMIEAIAGWPVMFPAWLYQAVVASGLAVGILGDISARWRPECREGFRDDAASKPRHDEVEPALQEVGP